MADQTNTATGVVGRLGPPPRKALGSSAIAAEQAYRRRSGLPELTEEDIAALKAGEPMPWERGGAVSAAASAPATPAPAAPAAVAPPAPTAAAQPAAAGISAEVAAMMAGGRKWSRSSIAAEQARRKRSNLPPLTDAEVAALLGEAAPAATPAAPAAATSAAPAAAAPAAPAARPPAAAAIPPPPIAREGTSTRYVGTPAVGTSKAAAAGGVAAVGPENTEVDKRRRHLVWAAVAAFLTAWLLAFFRFFLPRTLFEPSTVFKIGYPTDYGLGVNEKWLQAYRIWVDRTPDRLFVIYARCTHLGCTPDWKAAENKFKCPCHGSGYDSEGINFEGPAPRPMDRADIRLAPDGQIVVDTAHLYSWPKGQPSHFDDAGAFLPV
ncbi:MAG TPA: ubiquinol-cytochrome c reductase iron-sulfur subunit [Terriglobales bacterium]|jgi:cytochrome b6-f complex iron-sulfur subunit|nr:ubiquinol-cytochrome c reductase iron-sulfur subunit [Terriglobales bacterium]